MSRRYVHIYKSLILGIEIDNVLIAFCHSLPYRYAITTILTVALIASLASV